MCGINGCFVFENSSFRVSLPYLEQMRDTMAHRGPDGEGAWISDDKRLGLGHRRLAIIDLSEKAAQPMCNARRDLWIVFNGEIYNHAEIRSELMKIGNHVWQTDHSDTEVILHAFRQWGIECLEKLRGMFAFALWDARTRELWLVRDRIGIKPLYYSVHNGRITFASEIKALLLDPQQERAVDEEAFYHYLSFLTTPAPQTLFKGIRKLPGGTWLRVRANGEIYQQRYWDAWDHVTPLAEEDEDQIAEMILAELRTAVSLRKISDVPVGVFLSGGIDSSTNTALFSEGEQRAVKTFSIGYQGQYQSYTNELHFARQMADSVAAEYSERLLTVDDLINFLPRMVHLQDEPIADPVCVPVFYVSELARNNGIIVCQVGEGADELYWGYPTWKTALRLQQWNNLPVPPGVKQMALAALRASGRGYGMRYEYLRRGASNLPIFWGGAEAFSEREKKRLISPRLRRELHNLDSWDVLDPIYRRFAEKAWEPSHLHWMSYLDLNLRLPELLLMRVDKMSMGVSLEGRVPFLDHKFVELALSIPQSLKVKNGISKYMLKKAVRGLIPDELIDRPKQGFGVPVYEWFYDRLGDEIRQELSAFCDHADYLDRGAVMELLDQQRGPQAWYLFNFALWWKEFIGA